MTTGDGLKHVGSGLAWMGFWLMIGLANFGENPVSDTVNYFYEYPIEKESEQQSENVSSVTVDVNPVAEVFSF